ncbi:MAG: GNAT family N-acetyltransferase [Chitinophagales bacterium]
MSFEIRLSANAVFRQVAFNSAEMQDLIALRYQILRKPLHLQFTPEQLAGEADFCHFGFYIEGTLVACLMLVPDGDDKMKMKQVAVADHMQGQGIGKKMVTAAERFAYESGYRLIYCHARETAVPFYRSLGYTEKGEQFTEVGIPHYYMEKALTNAAN